MNYLMTKEETREIIESIIEYFSDNGLIILYIVIKLIPIIITIALIITVFMINKHLKSIEKINEKLLEKISKTEQNNNSEK